MIELRDITEKNFNEAYKWVLQKIVNTNIKRVSSGQLLNMGEISPPQPTPEASFDSTTNNLILAINSEYVKHISKQRKPPLMGGFVGGAEGNRTPVRKQLGRNFSGRSLLFTFP